MSKSRRKRKHNEDELEDLYMQRLAREDAKEAESAAAERPTKRLKAVGDVERRRGDGQCR